MMSFNCSCTEAERSELVTNRFHRHAVELKLPYTIPPIAKLNDAKNEGIVGKTFSYVPDAQFFDALVEGAGINIYNFPEYEMRARQSSANALANHIAELARSGAFKTSWKFEVDFNGGGLKRPLDRLGAATWIAAEQRGGPAYRYNVPLKWVVPCSSFPKGCPQ
jgi:hypothetical protein